MPLHGKTIWISGASSGIGAALSIELSRRGASIVLSARRTDQLDRVRQACNHPDDHLVLPLDMTRTETHEHAYEQILSRFGQVDILIPNAGIGQRSRSARTSLSVERTIMDVNFFGVLSLVHTVIPDMLKCNRGQIAIMSSVMGHVSTPMHSTYAASKHALHGYFESMRAELIKTDIAITMICPGYIHTDFSKASLLRNGQKYGKMDDIHATAMPAEVFARKAARAIQRRKKEVLIGGPEITVIYLKRFFPRLYRFLMPRLYHIVIKGDRPGNK